MQIALIAIYLMLSCSYLAGGGGCCSCIIGCMLLLHPLPANADASPDLCNLCPDLCAMHSDLCILRLPLRSTGANMPLAQVTVVTSCNLHCWCFFMQRLLAQIIHLHTWWYQHLQLVLVVLLHPVTGAKTVLALGQLALCGCGHWWWYNN